MKIIAEQARQNPRNATPIGWDAEELCYPAVNTCITISAIGGAKFERRKEQRDGMLVGLHLGMFMGAGEEGGKGSEDSKPIDDAYLDMYLYVMEKHVWLKAGGAKRLIVTGATEMWEQAASVQWRKITTTLGVWRKKMNFDLEIIQFDDSVLQSVDIYVSRSGPIDFRAPIAR